MDIKLTVSFFNNAFIGGRQFFPRPLLNGSNIKPEDENIK